MKDQTQPVKLNTHSLWNNLCTFLSAMKAHGVCRWAVIRASNDSFMKIYEEPRNKPSICIPGFAHRT